MKSEKRNRGGRQGKGKKLRNIILVQIRRVDLKNAYLIAFFLSAHYNIKIHLLYVFVSRWSQCFTFF